MSVLSNLITKCVIYNIFISQPYLWKIYLSAAYLTTVTHFVTQFTRIVWSEVAACLHMEPDTRLTVFINSQLRHIEMIK